MAAGGTPTSRLARRRAHIPTSASSHSSRAPVAFPDEPVAMPTVLHVIEAIAGGTSRHLIDLVRHTHGVRHIVATPRRRIGAVPDDVAIRDLRAAGADVHFVEMRRSPAHPRNAVAVAQISALARRFRPDIIHGHSAIGGALARAVPARGNPLRFYTPNGLNQSRLALVIERRLVRRTDRIVAVSASEATLLASLELADGDSLLLVPNAIEDPTAVAKVEVDLRELAGIPPGALLVGSLARLLPQKAPERFVECCRLVAKENADAYFLLIGDGPQAAEIDAQADCDELRGRFVRLPQVQEAAALLKQLDVFVLLSRFEGGPYAPMEAMFGGTPVVLSDGVGNVDVLSGELERLIVPDGDPAGAALRVSYLLEHEETRRLAGEACREYAKRNFDVAQMGSAYSKVYRRAVLRPDRRLWSDASAPHGAVDSLPTAWAD